MKKIDLYDYFKIERKEGLEGYLTVFGGEGDTAILVIAGGGYDHVSKREQDSVANAFMARGYKPFILHYTTKVKFPVAMFEASLAMIYIRQNAKALKICEDKVVGVGFSAGGHLLGCLGIIPDDNLLKNCVESVPALKGIDIDKTVRPDAMVLSYPVITSEENKCHFGSFYQLAGDDKRLIDYLSLEKRVNKSSAPCFIWHTRNDGSVPVYGSIKLALSYEQNGLDFSLHIFEKGKHGLSVATSEVNAEDVLKEASTGVSCWVDLSVNWLKDRGFS